MSELIEPKKITLKSKVREGAEKELRIGYYPATEGIRLLGLFTETIDVAARKKSKDVNGLFGETLQKFAIEVCQYVDVKLKNGEWHRLNSEVMINAHIADYEMLLSLVREVHDYNSFFFNSGKLLKTSLKWMDQAKAQATKIFQDLSVSLSGKKPPRSKS